MSRKQRTALVTDLDSPPGKPDVRIVDFVDAGHPALLRMWGKRQRDCRAMVYRIETEAARHESLL